MRIGLDSVLIAAGVIAGVALVAWWAMPRPISVETAKVTTGTFVATIDEDGKTRVRERYTVTAPIAGQSTRVRLKVGDGVSAGDTIISILPSPAPFLDPRAKREAEERLGAAEATRERTQAMVERARAQAAQARTDLERTRALAQRGVASTQALERNELALRVAERDVRAAKFLDHATEHDLSQARALLARYGQSEPGLRDKWDVTAPVEGVVLKVLQESETALGSGVPIIEIADLRDLEIVIDVLSTDALEIHPGAKVQIERWGGQGVLAGEVRRAEPEAFTKISTLGVEEQRVNVIVDLLSPQESWTGLGDGFRVDARITVLSIERATMVPSGAVFRTGDNSYVFVVKVVGPSAAKSNWCDAQNVWRQSRRA
jgi:HlyD family secretion protein